jgi:hypothetical protein
LRQDSSLISGVRAARAPWIVTIDWVSTQVRYLPHLLLLLLSLVLFVPGQASLPPLDRAESRYAQATALETGNFVDIRFQDEPRYLPPAGI